LNDWLLHDRLSRKKKKKKKNPRGWRLKWPEFDKTTLLIDFGSNNKNQNGEDREDCQLAHQQIAGCDYYVLKLRWTSKNWRLVM